MSDHLPQVGSGRGSRRKGSTKAQKQKDIAKELLSIKLIAKEDEGEFSTVKSNGERVKKGFLKRLIDEKKKEFGINISISSRNIRNRTHRGLQTAHHGAKSPLEEVEVALVEICIQMGKIRQPLSCTEAITLMNDMIENTNTKQKLIEFQQSRKLGTYGFEKGKVTRVGGKGF